MTAAAVPIVEQHLLLRAAVTVEENGGAVDSGKMFQVHFDVQMGNVAKRVTVTFDEDGFDSLVAQCQSLRSGLVTARHLPPLEPVQ